MALCQVNKNNRLPLKYSVPDTSFGNAMKYAFRMLLQLWQSKQSHNIHGASACRDTAYVEFLKILPEY